MRVVAQFDPSAKTSDTFNAGFSNGVGQLVVWNESDENLQLAWGAFTAYCPAWTANKYCISTNNVNIQWSQLTTLSSSGAPISQVIVEAYDQNEPVIGTFPVGLNRHFVGNPITAVGMQTQTLYNNGFPAGTQVISMAVQGDSSASWTAWNDGTLQLFLRLAANSYTQALIVQLSEPYVEIGVAGHNLRLVGKVQASSDASDIDWTLSAISHGTGTSVNGSANFTHNLKVAGVATTPDIVLITPTGGQFSYAVTAKTSTQFTLSASAAQTFDFVALKF